MRILVTGAAGMVGSHFVEALKDHRDIILLTPTINELDITDQNAINTYFDDNRPGVVVHFAAYTDVTAAENERGNKHGACWRINVEGTGHIARRAKHAGCYMISISTDYVFSGRSDDPGPYEESHSSAQDSEEVTWYGWTKAQAEKIAQKENPESAIVRIANPVRVGYVEKADLSKKIVQKYDKGEKIALFDDQYMTITLVPDVTLVLQKLIKKKKNGVFHVSSCDVTTPFAFGEYLLETSRNAPNIVSSLSLEQFLGNENSQVRYPQYGGLDVKKTQQELGIQFSTWKQIVELLTTWGI